MMCSMRGIIAVLWLCVILLTTGSLFAAPAPGPLVVNTDNPRYFMVKDDPARKAIYLTGSHVWNNLQDYGPTDPPAPLDFTDHLNFLNNLNHNFTRGWNWEQPKYLSGRTEDYYIDPVPFLRTGPGTAQDGKPKFDVTQYYQPYFDRIRARAVEAGNRGMYISIMLFEGFSIEDKGRTGTDNPWWSHPFNQTNNINGINGDPNGDGQGKETHTLQVPAVTTQQENYVKKYIDELNDLDNIFWEISNESHGDSVSWQYHLIDHIHSYEAAYKPKQHLVWMSTQRGYTNASIDASNAEVVNYNDNKPLWKTNPPVATGNKIVIVDTDHLWGIGGDANWVWKCFFRGHHPVFMDPLIDAPGGYLAEPNNPAYVALRKALGYSLICAEKMHLAKAIPGTSIASTNYCLADPGIQYLVYQPNAGSSFNVNLQSSGYSYEWFDTSTGTVTQTGSFNSTGGTKSFTPPFSHAAAVLYLEENEVPVAVIGANPATGPSPLTVNFDAAGSYDESGGNIVSYEWDFYNDGSRTATGQTANYVYRSSTLRTFTAALTVTDNDGYSDNETVVITVQPGQAGDFDGDGDVDQEDFGHFQTCMTGSGIPQIELNCFDTFLDEGNDVDLADFTIFQGCMSGANVPADPNCATN